MHRRDFLRDAAALALIGLHARTGSAFGARPPQAASGRVRLLKLTLQTSATLDQMRQFYGGVLGLKVLEHTATRLTIAGGETALTFTPASAGAARPFYHFAFNIPENKIERAWEWQKSRTPLITIPERLRDPRYPPDVVNYAHWSAHSVFFLDPGGNVVEYIARHDLANGRPGPFGPQDILHASEIAFVVDDVLGVSQLLREKTALNNFRGAVSEQFTALGDDDGLLLVMRRGRVLNFDPVSREKAASVFPTAAVVRGNPGSVVIDGFPYEIELGNLSVQSEGY